MTGQHDSQPTEQLTGRLDVTPPVRPRRSFPVWPVVVAVALAAVSIVLVLVLTGGEHQVSVPSSTTAGLRSRRRPRPWHHWLRPRLGQRPDRTSASTPWGMQARWTSTAWRSPRMTATWRCASVSH